MCESARVLSNASGPLHAALMFIGEAPGRLGADQTSVPFHGDAAGETFEDLLAFAGIRRDDVFVTNAVLCNPRDSRGNNASPQSSEISNCAAYLRRQIDLVNPPVVVALGAAALRSASLIERHSLSLSAAVRTAHRWYGRTLIALYHPGRRAMLHRSLPNQRSDYQFVAEYMRRVGARSRPTGTPTRADILDACHHILSRRGEVSYFALHKLFYLAEYLHVKATGRRMTSAYFIRQKDGPYCTDLHIARLRRADPAIQSYTRKGQLFLRVRDSETLALGADTSPRNARLRQTIDDALVRYDYSNEADLKKAVYLTAPMRVLLRRERYEHINLYNAPIDFLGGDPA
jgi:uracil-DNA glycosylase family 4